MCIKAYAEGNDESEALGWLHGRPPEKYVSLKWKGIHSGLLRDYECEEPVLDIFSDADWAADRTSRRSVSGSAIFYGGCLIYSSSRTQKIVSLSSAESETYAPAPLSWMPFSLGQSYVGYFRFAFSCISFWIHQLQGEFYHVVVLVVWDISVVPFCVCRILWVRNFCKWRLFWAQSTQPTSQPKDSVLPGWKHWRFFSTLGAARVIIW